MTSIRDEMRWRGVENCVEFSVHHYGGWRPVYPFEEMGEGDYFYIGSEEEAKKVRHAIQNLYRKDPVNKFIVVRVDTDTWICRKVM